jgi:hypothetical protein
MSYTTASSVTVTIRPDWTAFTNAMARVARATRAATRSMTAVQRTMERFSEEGRQRQELALTGLEARFYVRGGLDPLYASQAGLDGLVRDILQGPETGWECLKAGALPTRENRVRLAVAAMEGWVGPE